MNNQQILTELQLGTDHQAKHYIVHEQETVNGKTRKNENNTFI